MLNISVRVPRDRGRGAAVEIRSGFSTIATGSAAATASAELAARHGNALRDPLRPWGHPPFGGYSLLGQGPAPAGCDIEYGGELLVFQPMSGMALDAESFGRLLLLVYAGPGGNGSRLRPTQGGLRLQQTVFNALLAALANDPEALLDIEELSAPAWWQFWRSAVATPPLDTSVPKLSLPPLDEASLATALAAGRRIARKNRLQQDDDDWRNSRSQSDTSSGSSGGYSGQGGTFGGAGASGRWDAPAGVDSAGRIVGAASGATLATASIDAESASSLTDDGKAGSDSRSESNGGGDISGGISTGTSTSY